MTDSSTENMLEEHHSHHRFPRSHSGITIGYYKHCEVLAIYTRLISIRVVMLEYFGLKVPSDRSLHPWKTAPCFLKRDSCFSPHELDKKRPFGIYACRIGHWQVPQDADFLGCSPNTPLTNTGCWAAAPGFAVHAGDNAVPLQLVPRGAVVLTPRAKVGTIQTLEAPVGRHGQGGATLFWKRKQRNRFLLEICYPPFTAMHVWGITQK